MFGFDLDTTTAPAVDWGNRAMPPVVPAGADLVMKAVHDAGLSANGQDPAVADIFEHYVDEGAAFPPKAAMFAQNDQARISDFPGGRTGLKIAMEGELKGHRFMDDVKQCVAERWPYAEAACAQGRLPSGELAADSGQCPEIWENGRHAMAPQQGQNQLRTDLRGGQFAVTNGAKLGIPGFEVNGGTTQTDVASTALARGSTTSMTESIPAEKGLMQLCFEMEKAKHHVSVE